MLGIATGVTSPTSPPSLRRNNRIAAVLMLIAAVIHRMGYEVEGDIDLRAFLGQDMPRPGFAEIRISGTVSSPNASDEQLTELCQYVQDTSPVRDIIANPVPVHTSLQVV